MVCCELATATSLGLLAVRAGSEVAALPRLDIIDNSNRMKKSRISVNKKKKVGRPRVYTDREGGGAQLIGIRMPPDEVAAVDGWIAAQPEPQPSRPEAIRRLTAAGLQKYRNR